VLVSRVVTSPADDQRRTQVTRLDRHESAIMLTDIVGYTRIMRADEERALQLLDEHNTIVRDSIDKHSGFIAKVMGDAFLAEFFEPSQSIACAVDIQQRLHRRNNSVPEERKVFVRIGLHFALVTPMGSDIIGDGVNVVSRIEPVSPPGGVCLSSFLYEKVKDGLTIPVRDLGLQSLKNIDEPLHLFQIDPVGEASVSLDPTSDAEISLGAPETTLGANHHRRRPGLIIGIVVGVAALGALASWRIFASRPEPSPTVVKVDEDHRKPDPKTEPSPPPLVPVDVHSAEHAEPPKPEVHEAVDHHAPGVTKQQQAALQARLKKDLARLEKLSAKKQKKIASDEKELIKVERELAQGRRDLDLRWLEKRLETLERDLPRG
jgi:class 3 adenylate cyclase